MSLEKPLDSHVYEGTEYHFFERIDGNPRRTEKLPGQVVAYEIRGYKIRVPFERLPTTLQYIFVHHTKKTAEEIGIKFRFGCGA